MLAVGLRGCATPPSRPKRWEPALPPELGESCRNAPLECRRAAETLAARWTTDEEAFGALKAFTAACRAGDAESCSAVDRRFTRVRSLKERPAPEYPRAAFERRLQGTWAATCTVSRTGEISGCLVEQSVPEIDPPFLEWIRAGPWQAPTLDGRAFGCEYRFWFSLTIH